MATEDDKIDRRRLRGSATRARAIEAAAELFSTRGYSATSMAAIAEAAGARSASLYHAFGSKEQLLGAVVEHASDDFHAYLDETVDQGNLEDAICNLGLLMDSRPRFVRLLLVLILERSEGDPSVLQSAVTVRDRARARLRDYLENSLPTEITAKRREAILDDTTRMIFALFDGLFIARQVELDANEFQRLFGLVTAAIAGVLAELTSRSNPRDRRVAASTDR